MNRFSTATIKSLTLLFAILISGCATHGQMNNSTSVVNLKTAQPQYVSIQNGRLEYYRVGHGSPIVLIAGYATDITSWDKQFLATLANKHQLIVFNNRNVGGSVVQSPHYESRDLANDTSQLIKNLHLRKPAVLGISMGGMIAQQVAVLYPHEIGALILINTAIAGKHSAHPSPETEKRMLNMPTSKLGRYRIAVKLFFPASERTAMAFALIFDRFQPSEYTEIDPNAVISQQRSLVLQWTKNEAAAKKLRS